MTKLKITFENFPTSSIDFLENLVDDYDYEGGFDPESFETTNNAGKFIVDITSNKEFSLDDDDLDDNLLDVLVDRGNFFSHLYFSLDDLDVDEAEIKITVEIDKILYSVDLGKDCELIPL